MHCNEELGKKALELEAMNGECYRNIGELSNETIPLEKELREVISGDQGDANRSANCDNLTNDAIENHFCEPSCSVDSASDESCLHDACDVGQNSEECSLDREEEFIKEMHAYNESKEFASLKKQGSIEASIEKVMKKKSNQKILKCFETK